MPPSRLRSLGKNDFGNFSGLAQCISLYFASLCPIIYQPAHTSLSRAYPIAACPRCLALVSLDVWGTHGLGFSADIQMNRHYDLCHATNLNDATVLEGKGS